MTREATERSLANRTAHAMRVAALRLARERAGEDADPAQAYGCVDWFRYDAPSPPEHATAPPPVAARRDAGQGGASSAR